MFPKTGQSTEFAEFIRRDHKWISPAMKSLILPIHCHSRPGRPTLLKQIVWPFRFDSLLLDCELRKCLAAHCTVVFSLLGESKFGFHTSNIHTSILGAAIGKFFRPKSLNCNQLKCYKKVLRSFGSPATL